MNPQNLLDNICVLDYNAGGLGFGLQSSPQYFSTTSFSQPFSISNHRFVAGRSLAFFAGFGSTKQGYRFNVDFDSPTWASGANVPSSLFKAQTSNQATTTTLGLTTPVSPGCALSVSLAAYPTSGQTPLTVVFSTIVSGASGSVQYDWWFGDGSHTTGNPRMTYTYVNPWNYNVVVQVTDAKGCWSKSSTTVFVTEGSTTPEFPSGPLVLLSYCQDFWPYSC